MEIRSPVLTSMSYSRGGWVALTESARWIRSSVVLPMALTTATTSEPCAARPGDVVGHGTDPIGVADRGAAELLDDQWHPDEATDCAPARRPPEGVSPAARRPGGRGPPARVGDPRAPRGLGRVSGRAQRQESPPARGQGGPAGRRGQAAEAPQADPERDHRRGGRRRHRGDRLPRLGREQHTGVLAVQGRQHDDARRPPPPPPTPGCRPRPTRSPSRPAARPAPRPW